MDLWSLKCIRWFSSSTGCSGNATLASFDNSRGMILQTGSSSRAVALCRGNGYAATQCYIHCSSNKIMAVCGSSGEHLTSAVTYWTSANDERLIIYKL